MTSDDSDPPSRHEAGAFSGLFPQAPTLEAVHKAQRKQAEQLVAMINAARDAVKRDRTNATALKEFKEEVEEKLGTITASIAAIGRAFHEFELKLATDAVPEALERGKQKAQLAWLLAAVGMGCTAVVSLLWYFATRGHP